MKLHYIASRHITYIPYRTIPYNAIPYHKYVTDMHTIAYIDR